METVRNARFMPRSSPLEAGEDSDVPGDLVLDLLMTQRADGSFRISNAFRELLAEQLDAIEAAIDAGDEATVITAVIVQYLELHESDHYHEYRSALKKAKDWLRGQENFDAAGILG